MRNIGFRKGGLILTAVASLLYVGWFYFYIADQRVIAEGVAESLARTRPEEAERKANPPQTAQLLFVGDVMLSRAVGELSRAKGDPNFPFALASSTLRAADLTFGNLEGPISDKGANQGSEYSFRAAPTGAGALRTAGFKVMSVANNHIWDYGAPALTQTLDLLKQGGMRPVGAGRNAEEANQPVRIVVRGNRIVFLAYTNLYPESLQASTSTPGISKFDLGEIKKTIRRVRRGADVVVVSLHFGEEYRMSATLAQKQIAHELVNAGADLIVGHHPHVVEELEQYGQGWIAYSLGNFVFDQPFSAETLEGGALRVSLAKGRVEQVELIPVKISKATYQPSF